MKALSWNCRGLGSPRSVRELKSLLNTQDPDFVFLCETRLPSSRMEALHRTLFWNGISVGASGQRGGLSFWWKSTLSVSLFILANLLLMFCGSLVLICLVVVLLVSMEILITLSDIIHGSLSLAFQVFSLDLGCLWATLMKS